jgi:hypothetical protein
MPAAHHAGKKRRASVLSVQSDVIYISSDDEDLANPSKRREPAKRVKINPDLSDEVIDLSTDVDAGIPKAPDPPSLVSRSAELKALLANAQPKKGKFTLTRKTKVDELVYLDRVPNTFEVAPIGKEVAYVIDLAADGRRREPAKGKGPRNLDALIKLEVSPLIMRLMPG